MEARWTRVTEAQERARALPIEAFRRELGSAVLLSHETRSGLLRTGWARASGVLIRSTHALVRKVTVRRTGEHPVLTEEDWASLDAHGQLWLSLPWALDVSKPEWLTVGRRASADIVINDYTVSTRHAQVRRTGTGETLAVVDLGSTNGTEAAGSILSEGEQAEVESRSLVVFGRQVFLFLTVQDFYDLLCGDEVVTAVSESAS